MVDYTLDFLEKIDNLKIRIIYARIMLLDFNTEATIQAIEGQVTGGNVSISSSSRIRRSLNLQMFAKQEYANLEKVDNLISLNRKIKVEIGIEHPFADYSPIAWFPIGVFVISTANTTKNTSGWNISITAKDKMVLLNGTCGGQLPGAAVLHEKYIQNEDGSETAVEVPIIQIIQELVHHIGHEEANNIIINDLPEYGTWILSYYGNSPIYFATNYSTVTNNIAEAKSWGPNNFITVLNGEDVGYEETLLVYPGELIASAGDSVTSILDKIIEQLDNFEYFYDIDGRFVFQQIKNYTNTASPISAGRVNELDLADYLYSFSNTRYQYTFTNQNTTVAITKTPNYDNIKNDFIVWGTRQLSNNTTQALCYRLAIDDKPEINFASKYWWKRIQENQVYYEFSDDETPPNEEDWELIGKPCSEWREELYRQAVMSDFYGEGRYSDYDAELLAFWRDEYDTVKWPQGWDPAIIKDPGSIVFWLDFVDGGAEVNKYSVRTIGRRTKVENNDKIKSLFTKTFADVIFLRDPDEQTIQRYEAQGQKWFKVNDKYDALFDRSHTGITAFDIIREMLYKYLVYNTAISITSIPKYYLECNNIVHIQDIELAIDGNYCITNMTIPLTYNGTMQIQLSEVLTRV